MGNVNVNYTPNCGSCSNLTDIHPLFTEMTTIEQVVNTMNKNELHTTVFLPHDRLDTDIDERNLSYPITGLTSLDVVTKNNSDRQMRIANIINDDCAIYTNVFEYIWNDLSKYCIGKTQCHKMTFLVTATTDASTNYYFRSDFGYCVFRAGVEVASGGIYESVSFGIPEIHAENRIYTPNGDEITAKASTWILSERPVDGDGATYIQLIPTSESRTTFGNIDSTSSDIDINDLNALIEIYSKGAPLDSGIVDYASCTYGETNIGLRDIVTMLRYINKDFDNVTFTTEEVHDIMALGSDDGALMDLLLGDDSSDLMTKMKNIPIYRGGWDGEPFTATANSNYIKLYVIKDDMYYELALPVKKFSVSGGTTETPFIFVFNTSTPVAIYIDPDTGTVYRECMFPVGNTSTTTRPAHFILNTLNKYEYATILANSCYRWVTVNGWRGSVDECSKNIITMVQNEFEKINPDSEKYYSVIYPCGDTLLYKGNNCINSNINNKGLYHTTSESPSVKLYDFRTSLAIPAKFYGSTSFIEEVEDDSDREWSGLVGIDFAYGVTTVPSYIYSGCFQTLRTINLPSTITHINAYAFRYCAGAKINFNPTRNLYIANGAFYDTQNALSWTDLPKTIMSIGDYAFTGCKNFTKLTIPSNVTIINEGTFKNCTNVTELIIHNKVTEIKASAFSDCTSIMTIRFLGTKTEWEAIAKGSNWNFNVPANIIYCNDETIIL